MKIKVLYYFKWSTGEKLPIPIHIMENNREFYYTSNEPYNPSMYSVPGHRYGTKPLELFVYED